MTAPSTWVLPTFHPAHILRKNRKLEGLLVRDLKRAAGLSTGRWKPTLVPDESKFNLRPTADEVEATLARMAKSAHTAYDIETNGEHPCSEKLDVRCIGFHDGKEGINVPFLFRDGTTTEVVTVDKKGKSKVKTISVWKPYFGGSALKRVLVAIQKFFDTAKALDTQNGQYDRLCLQMKLALMAPWGDPHFDDILAHHVVASYLPHGLDLLTSIYTDMPYYKKTEEGEAWSTSSDRELWLYCIRDCFAQWMAAEKLRKEVRERPEDLRLYHHDARQEHECQEWKRAGIEVDEEALALFRQHYAAVSAKALKTMKEIVQRSLKGGFNPSSKPEEIKPGNAESSRPGGVGHDIKTPTKANTTQGKREKNDTREIDDERGLERLPKEEKKLAPLDELLERLQDKADEEDVDDLGAVVEKFNPASLLQLRALLIGIGIPLSAETATGQLSTAEEFLLTARKELLSQGVKPTDDRLLFLDCLFAWRASKKVEGTYLRPNLIRHLYIGVNGTLAVRLHPTFSVHVVPTGRLSSKDPNFQNQPATIRGMYVARPGHILVYIDWDALEMRLGAFMSGDQTFIKDFAAWDARTGPKVHIVNMCAIFNLPMVPGVEDKYPGCYRAAKVFAYAVAYGAGEATVFEQVRAEMPDMDFPTFKKVFAAYKVFRKRLFEFQKDVVRRGTQNQYLDSTILQRRVYFFEKVFGEDSPEASAMQNMPYQATGSDVVELANFRILDKVVLPMQKQLKSYTVVDGKKVDSPEVCQQLAQVHDELLFEVPDREDFLSKFCPELKRVAEEPPGPKYKSWSLPVDLKKSKRWKPIKWKCTHCDPKLKNKVELELAERNVTHGTSVISLWTGKCDVCKKTTSVEVIKGEAHHEEKVAVEAAEKVPRKKAVKVARGNHRARKAS